jgi:hypothetical protein
MVKPDPDWQTWYDAHAARLVFLDDTTPARILRRMVVERHRAPDGRAELRVPRADVILLPVAFQ